MDFPCSDISLEILARSSLETLDACKVVSKEWSQIVYESSFMPFYCEKTSNVYGFLLQSLVSNKHVYEFVSMNNESEKKFKVVSNETFKSKFDDIKIEASSKQGILCCVKRSGRQHRYYVCKPTSGQWQAIPNPKLRYTTAKVALLVLSSSPLRYKIIRISDPLFLRRDCNHYRCEIFDSQTWAWKEAENILLPKDIQFDNNPAICCNGKICWLINDNHILAYDHQETDYFRFSLPDPVCKDHRYTHKRIIEYQGKLGLTCMIDGGGDVKLWVLKQRKSNQTWELRKEVSIDLFEEEAPTHPSPAGFYNSDIALLKSYLEVAFWNPRDFSFKKIKLDELYFAEDVFAFRSDWESINLRDC